MGVRLEDSNVQWLGQCAWYTISDHEPISAAQLLAWVDEIGLDLVSRPTPRTADAFKTATSAMTAKFSPADGIVCDLEFRQIKATDDVVVRHLFVTTTDTRQGRSTREKVAEVKFHRPTKTHTGRRQGSEQITHRLAQNLDPLVQQQAEELIEKLYAGYQERIAYLNEGTLRKTIRDLIDVRMRGLPLRRSGVYFILPEHLPTLNKLALLVQRMGASCNLHYLPLVDDARQRDLLADALAAETLDLATSISEAIEAGGGSLPGRPRTVLTERLAAQRAKVEELDARLGVTTLVTKAALAEAGEALLSADPVYRARLARLQAQT
jgi:hypothetical protein